MEKLALDFSPSDLEADVLVTFSLFLRFIHLFRMHPSCVQWTIQHAELSLGYVFSKINIFKALLMMITTRLRVGMQHHKYLHTTFLRCGHSILGPVGTNELLHQLAENRRIGGRAGNGSHSTPLQSQHLIKPPLPYSLLLLTAVNPTLSVRPSTFQSRKSFS